MKRWKEAFIILLYLALWQTLGSVYETIPTPSKITLALISETKAGNYFQAVLDSLLHYYLGAIGGIVLGALIGATCTIFPSIESLTKPFFILLRPIPPIAWIPVTIIAFGITHTGAAFIIALGVFWVMQSATYTAFKQVNSDFLELACIYNFKKTLQLVRKIYIPATLPTLLSTARSALGQAWMFVVGAELFGVPGIGQRLWESAGVLANDLVALYMLTVAALYFLSDSLLILISKLRFEFLIEDIAFPTAHIALPDVKNSALIATLSNISFSHQGAARPLLNNISLDIYSGKIYILMGDSGAGKSTLLRLIAGLLKPSLGEVILKNKSEVPCAFIFQDPRLLPWRNIYENVAFGVEALHISNKSEKILAALRSVTLDELKHRYPDQLSGGQKQRVALARALVSGAQLILMDEPLSALNHEARSEMQELIVRIAREENKAVVLVTHDLKEANSIGDQCLYLQNDGRLQNTDPNFSDMATCSEIHSVA